LRSKFKQKEKNSSLKAQLLREAINQKLKTKLAQWRCATPLHYCRVCTSQDFAAGT
jgi:hypothetical protein